MTTIQLPSINIPAGREREAAALLRSLKAFFNFTSEPAVVSDAGVRTFTASLEHAMEQGAKQAESAISEELKQAA